MKKLWKFTCLAVLVFIFFLYPGTRPRPLPCRYAVRADVTLYRGTEHQRRIYLQPDKIRSVLNFLRTTNPYGQVSAAPAIPNSHHYQITLYFCDGSQSRYFLQDYRYYSKNSKLWQKVPLSHAQLLYPLIQLLPPDL